MGAKQAENVATCLSAMFCSILSPCLALVVQCHCGAKYALIWHTLVAYWRTSRNERNGKYEMRLHSASLSRTARCLVSSRSSEFRRPMVRLLRCGRLDLMWRAVFWSAFGGLLFGGWGLCCNPSRTGFVCPQEFSSWPLPPPDAQYNPHTLGQSQLVELLPRTDWQFFLGRSA